MFSKACEYGIRSCLFLAMDVNGQLFYDVRQIAEHIKSPVSFTAKILQKLKKGGVVDSQLGVNGGYYIENRRRKEITLDQIVSIIDGQQIYLGCGLGLDECDASKPCPVHDNFVKVRNELKTMLESTCLEDLKSELLVGETFLA